MLTPSRGMGASAMLGLVISSLVRSSEQIMPLFVVAVMAQLVLCGGMVPDTGRLGLDQLSFAMPARWGYAAAASTVSALAIAAIDASAPSNACAGASSAIASVCVSEPMRTGAR